MSADPTHIRLSRRAIIGGLAGAALTGCDAFQQSDAGRALLFSGETANKALQRTIMDRNALAREFGESDMSPIFRSNGTRDPDTPSYNAMAANGFADWTLPITGLVERPMVLSLDQIRAMPARTQITRHDCVEGWSAIGKWHGPQLSLLLQAAGLKTNARYAVFRCADLYNGTPYYESIDLIDAFHPQTILAWAMNDALLPIPHGAPLRLRVERQLGYKHAKYVEGIEIVDSLAPINGGQGGYWEDRGAYEWYAGI
ncbi:molybdopterin-binding protein [Croceicoccus marinus]|jgi:DMSO/TMAO reductase YedYZ molybdopterin-dependent catalytic subunit|uniref:Molybdopterin-dependent oxidoreductase n=1 Tax=Croceicoccus marinus TaxID=450378 RepID=A0A7G6VWP9_9SPHN|nr:molybdopterin-binding protein [Croceicoccus marinus]QNE06164.1 molybdopterin-dependent oxidoreductase [Croceicoccus marinus]